jgi:hypothetical protein
MLFLVHCYLDVNMIRRDVLRARHDTLQPLIPIIFLLRITIVVLAMPTRRCIDALMRHPPMAVAPAQKPTRLAFTLEQVRQRASRTRLNVEHAPEGGSGFAREEAEDGFGAAAVECSDAV